MKWLCFFMIWNKRRLIIYSGKTLNLRVPQYLKLLLFSINSDDYPLKRKISSAERGKYRKLDTCSVWLIAELSAWERFLMRKWTQFQKENPKKKFSASVRTLEQTLWVRMSTCKPEFFKTFFYRKLWWSSLHYSKIYLAMLSSRGILKTNNGREGVKCKLFCPRGLRNRVARPQTTSAKKATHFWLPLYYSRAEKNRRHWPAHLGTWLRQKKVSQDEGQQNGNCEQAATANIIFRLAAVENNLLLCLRSMGRRSTDLE